MSEAYTGDVVWVKCRLGKGLYSHERSYTIAAPGGGEYRGVVQVHFCRDARGNPIPDEHPTGEAPGRVEAMVVKQESGNFVVAIPGDQNIIVAPDLITNSVGARRVPVRP